LELSCLKNRGGRFIELCDYHSGSQQGNLRIPEGKEGAGWARFDRELRNFFLGEKLMNSDDRNGTVRISNFRNRRESYRAIHNSGKIVMDTSKSLQGIKPSVTPGTPRAVLSRVEPRPTHLSVFKWKSAGKTIRITVQEGLRREVSWVGFSNSSGPKPNELRALDNNKMDQALSEAHVERNLGLTHLKALVNHASAQVEAQVLLEPTSIQTSLKGPSEGPCEGSGLEKPDSLGEISRSFSDRVFDSSTCMDPDPLSPIIASQEVISPVRSADMDSDLQLAMVEDPISENPVTDSPSPINAIQESKLPVSSADMDSISQLVMMDDPISENPVSPLSCPPLNMVAPTTTPPPFRLSCGEKVMNNPSKWVSQQMNFFRKHVGVSISGHEPECLALLTRIDKDRQIPKPPQTPRKSVTKGLRELHNLSSSINYEGKQLSCC
jgi:hypothetical protein